jgi:hypothetical protein
MTPRCTHSTRVSASSASTALDLLPLHQPLPSRFDLTLDAKSAIRTTVSESIPAVWIHFRDLTRA